ncbi:MAG TPA: hypothetical protein VFV18_00325, partial [Porticoccaceae bacterium]|nr:hypothetical protein [Porticoccaceae bacterium]
LPSLATCTSQPAKAAPKRSLMASISMGRRLRGSWERQSWETSRALPGDANESGHANFAAAHYNTIDDRSIDDRSIDGNCIDARTIDDHTIGVRASDRTCSRRWRTVTPWQKSPMGQITGGANNRWGK